jgi:hypothetical protein
MDAKHASRRRRSASTTLIIIGWAIAFFGLASAFSGFGLPFLVFCPLLFLAGAYLVPSRYRIAQAVVIAACWLTGLGFVLA